MGFGRRLAAVSGATVLYVGAAAITYSFVKPTSKDASIAASFDSLADNYDGLVNREETFMGIKLLRWWLVKQAQGDVLEISAGTGRNLSYYDLDNLSSLTITDASKQMLWHAADKHKQLQSASQTPVYFKVVDAASVCQAGCISELPTFGTSSKAATAGTSGQRGNQCPPSLPVGTSPVSPQKDSRSLTPGVSETGYDTIIDTFGLCSHADPVKVLKEVARACKPGGKIYLLEHGRSSYGWLNRRLDEGAAQHCRRWACNWNLDIAEVVRDAGLKIDSVSRWHFGTTYVIVASPS